MRTRMKIAALAMTAAATAATVIVPPTSASATVYAMNCNGNPGGWLSLHTTAGNNWCYRWDGVPTDIGYMNFDAGSGCNNTPYSVTVYGEHQKLKTYYPGECDPFDTGIKSVSSIIFSVY